MSSMNPDIKGYHSVEKIDPITEVWLRRSLGVKT
jgi:hypothetical protein